MPTEVIVVLILFFLLVAGALAYTVIRLLREPPSSTVNTKAKRLARIVGAPSLFDNLLARPMTRREKFGWLLFTVILLIAAVVTGSR
jgi:hypothetical protein